MLEVLIAVVDVQTKLLDVLGTDVRALNLCTNISTNRSMAEKMASMVLQASPYLLSCLEGRVAGQLPLKAVARYYQRHHSHP